MQLSYKRAGIHLQVQLLLCKQLGNRCRLEKALGKRIGDVCVEDKKIVFEIQCSAISLQEVKERMRDYAHMGYLVIWILHDRQFSSTSLIVRYLRASPHLYTNMGAEGEGILYDAPGQEVLVTQIIETPALPRQAPLLLHKRFAVWPYHFLGDQTAAFLFSMEMRTLMPLTKYLGSLGLRALKGSIQA